MKRKAEKREQNRREEEKRRHGTIKATYNNNSHPNLSKPSLLGAIHNQPTIAEKLERTQDANSTADTLINLATTRTRAATLNRNIILKVERDPIKWQQRQ